MPLVVESPGDVDSVVAAAEQAAAGWELPKPELVRIGINGVFFCGETVLRVSRATAPMGVALRFAERLHADGIRAALPARNDWLEVPGGLSVTAWQRIRFDPTAAVDWERVGEMVAKVHAIDPLTVDHPLPYCGDFPWWNVNEMLPEADAGIVDDAARLGMRRCLEEHGWWIEQCRAAPPTLCHGDVHPGNVLVDDGGPVLIDWDLLCVGPAAWDHAPLLTWTDRWGGEPGLYEAFASGYGWRLDEAGAVGAAIAEMRLLIATLMRLRRARLDPVHASEAVRRLAYWRGDPDAEMWQAQ